MSQTHSLDVCGLPPPEPFEQIMTALDEGRAQLGMTYPGE